MADNLRYHPREAAKRDAVKDYAIKKWRKDVAAGREAAQAEAARRREAQWDIPSPGTPNAPGLPRDQFGRPHTFPKRLPPSSAIPTITPRLSDERGDPVSRPAPQNGVGAAAMEGALRGGAVIDRGLKNRVWGEEEPSPVPEEPPATPPAEQARELMKRKVLGKAKKGVRSSVGGALIGPAGRALDAGVRGLRKLKATRTY